MKKKKFMAGFTSTRIKIAFFALVTLLMFSPFCTLTKAEVAPPQIQWIKTYPGGIEGNVVIQTADGGYAIAGINGDHHATIDSYDNVTDILIKTDSEGNMQWNKTYGHSPAYYVFMVDTKDGGYAIAEGEIVGLRTATYLMKTDSEGNKQWENTYQEPGYHTNAHSLIQTSDGGCLIAGGLHGDQWTLGKGSKAWIVKIDSTGKTQWKKTYENFSSLNSPYESPYNIESIIEAGDGNYVFICSTNGTASLLVKIGQIGNVIWDKKIEGLDLTFNSIAKTADGGYVLAGTLFGSAYAVKVDSFGDFIWKRTYVNVDIFRSVLQAHDGGYVFTGRYDNDGSVILMKTDLEGKLEWNNTYHEIMLGIIQSAYWKKSSTIQASDGGYVFTGATSGIGLIKTLQENESQESPTPSKIQTSTSLPSPSQTPLTSPSPSVQEFPKWIILPALLIIVTLAAVAIRKKNG